jgi:hypothetical protein
MSVVKFVNSVLVQQWMSIKCYIALGELYAIVQFFIADIVELLCVYFLNAFFFLFFFKLFVFGGKYINNISIEK